MSNSFTILKYGLLIAGVIAIQLSAPILDLLRIADSTSSTLLNGLVAGKLINSSKSPYLSLTQLIACFQASHSGQSSCDNSNGLSIEKIKPQIGKGILFRADLEHFVLPSYTDEDRICIACNFRLENIQFNKVLQ